MSGPSTPWWIAAAVALGLSAGVACTLDTTFSCEGDAQCRDGARLGTCQDTGWCSFPDDACDSRERYVEFAGDGLAGQCVEQQAADGETGDGDGPPQVEGSSDGDDGAPDTTGDTGDDDDDATTTTGEPDDGSAVDGSAGDDKDPYGPCGPGCTDCCPAEGSACRTANDGRVVFQMCSPPCEVNLAPSSECPEAIEPGFQVGCLDTGTGENGCFILCNDGEACPAGMTCALGSVCSWV